MFLSPSPLHLIADVFGHLLVEAELLPLLVEGGHAAVAAHVSVEPARDVRAVKLISGVDVQGS